MKRNLKAEEERTVENDPLEEVGACILLQAFQDFGRVTGRPLPLLASGAPTSCLALLVALVRAQNSLHCLGTCCLAVGDSVSFSYFRYFQAIGFPKILTFSVTFPRKTWRNPG